MKILHLSETTLSGSPYRISQLINKHTEHESHHIVWKRHIFNRVFPCDMVGEEMLSVELKYFLDWADVIHYHNVYDKLSIFKNQEIPKKPSVIQIHSPRGDIIDKDVIDSKLPIAVIAQFHPRQWPELRYIIPNVVDISLDEYRPTERHNRRPIVSFAPSNGNGLGWNNKGYGTVNFYLRRQPDIQYQRIFNRPFNECLEMKRMADIGIDDIHTGSYHLSCLEYLALGVATICYTDEETEKVVKDLTGCTELPWIHHGKDNIVTPIHKLIHNAQHRKAGENARRWMETYWTPEILSGHYVRMYEDL